ncbi:MAG: hypothetical protein MJB12_00145 [Firmicutes bacterium]|nr:hypothetical protein [Bacillota bacterium]
MAKIIFDFNVKIAYNIYEGIKGSSLIFVFIANTNCIAGRHYGCLQPGQLFIDFGVILLCKITLMRARLLLVVFTTVEVFF